MLQSNWPQYPTIYLANISDRLEFHFSLFLPRGYQNMVCIIKLSPYYKLERLLNLDELRNSDVKRTSSSIPWHKDAYIIRKRGDMV